MDQDQEQEPAESGNLRSSRSRPQTKKKFISSWEETRQKFLAAQELGNGFLRTVATVTVKTPRPFVTDGRRLRPVGHLTFRVCAQVSGAQVDLPALLPAVRRRLERLHAIKQEVNQLWRHHQVQSQQQASIRRYQDRLQKVQKHHLDEPHRPSTEVLVLWVSDPAGPEERLRAAGLLHPDGPGFRRPDLQAAGTLQPGQTPFYRKSWTSRTCSTGTTTDRKRTRGSSEVP